MKKIIISIIFLICSVNVLAKVPNAKIAEIPFVLKNDIILLKVNINDNPEPSTFIFDTGATADLMDSKTARDLGLKANYKQDVEGAGGSKSYDVILDQKLTLQNKIEIDTHLVLSDLSSLKNALERNFDGIIGYSLISKYVTKIDYENQIIILYDKIQNVDIQGYKAIPFEFENGIPIPQFDISITLESGESFKDKILFDSGAGLTLLINSPYQEKHKLSNKAGKSMISESENLHAKSISEDIAIKSMNIGGYDLSEMVVSLAHDKSGASSYVNYLGILGAKVISKFNIVLDYSSSILYLKPNNNYIKPFEFPLTGMNLKKVDDSIIIKRIDKTCPFYKKGIRQGDKVLSINKISSGDIGDYREVLKKVGNIVHLEVVNSDGKTKNIKVTLNRLL